VQDLWISPEMFRLLVFAPQLAAGSQQMSWQRKLLIA